MRRTTAISFSILVLFLLACGDDDDASAPDASTDAATDLGQDASGDAGEVDLGVRDGGDFDGGDVDAGEVDADILDSGSDAGEPDMGPMDSDADGISDFYEGRYVSGGPTDTDADATPDYLDDDSDGDTISDADEGGVTLGMAPIDTDGGGVPDFRDLDSDDDLFLDATEAGDAMLATPTRDTDTDSAADYRDPDSDDDGLSDRQEHVAGSQPTRADTDGDGTSDLSEVLGCAEAACAGDVLDPSWGPGRRGVGVYTAPYMVASVPLVSRFASGAPPMTSSVTSEIVDGATDTVDIRAAFLEHAEPNPSGGFDAFLGTACISFPISRLVDADVDGWWDTVTMVGVGQQVCFDVSRKLNSTVAPTDTAAVYRGTFRGIAGATVIRSISLVFIVPGNLVVVSDGSG